MPMTCEASFMIVLVRVSSLIRSLRNSDLPPQNRTLVK